VSSADRTQAELYTDAYYSRRLRHHLLMSKSGELIKASDSLTDLILHSIEIGITILHLHDTNVTLALSREPKPERKEI